jgi:ribonuclease P protein component
MMKQFTFGKKERLSRRIHIDYLFNEGRSFNISAFKVFYRVDDPDHGFEVKILVAVSKKKFKKAVDRNRLKRLIREAYRLNKHLLFKQKNVTPLCLHIGFVYIGDKADVSHKEIEQQMIGCLERFGRILGSSNSDGSS